MIIDTKSLSAAATTTGSSGTCTWNMYQDPQLMHTYIYEDRVEQIFMQESNMTYTVGIYQSSSPPPRIYKEVYTIVNGKLAKTATIEGSYIPARGESYEFPEEFNR